MSLSYSPEAVLFPVLEHVNQSRREGKCSQLTSQAGFTTLNNIGSLNSHDKTKYYCCSLIYSEYRQWGQKGKITLRSFISQLFLGPPGKKNDGVQWKTLRC